MAFLPLPTQPSTPSPRSRRSSSVWDYETSLMFGQYREELATFAQMEAAKLKAIREDKGLENGRKSDRSRKIRQEKAKTRERIASWKLWRVIAGLCRFGGDMLFFTTLAIILALLSFGMDLLVHQFHNVRHYLTVDCTDSFTLRYLLWILYMLTFVLLSATITRVFAPQAAGSGVSEMKVILRGHFLKEYLSLKTLLTKLVGETFTLASGIYLGKEGPFVHISSMMAAQLMKLFYRHTRSTEEYESRFLEIMAVACGLGVAVTFASPVGGVLYSIEIVSVFFSVRSYWHGFFASAIGALFWRLLNVWSGEEATLTPLFKTSFRYDYPYETLELVAYALLGLLCGLAAAAYIALNRAFVLFNRRQGRVHTFLQKYPLLYPILVTVSVALVTFPDALGQFYTSWLTHDEAIRELFTNQTWYSASGPVVDHWSTSYTSIFTNTLLFTAMNILLIAICTTLPIPGGIIVPSFKIGAGFGRFYGETVAALFPEGISPRFNRTLYPILPGTYAVVGSAAFAGATTGAMSSAVIAFEATGQITHLLPVIVATLVATITARTFGPSIYDSLIILKKLPYLPSILPSSAGGGHSIFIEHFMKKEVILVHRKCTYRHLAAALQAKPKLRIFPFVRSAKCRILLGSVERDELVALLEAHEWRLETIQEWKAKVEANDEAKVDEREGDEVKEMTGSRFHVSQATIPEDGLLELPAPSATTPRVTIRDPLEVRVDFSSCHIEPAPFQLPEGTSLSKAHNLFSLLGLHLVYVTSLGALVGVVTLKELGKAIEVLNNHEEGRITVKRDERDKKEDSVKLDLAQ